MQERTFAALSLFRSFVRSFLFPEFFPAAICLKWSPLSLPPSLPRSLASIKSLRAECARRRRTIEVQQSCLYDGKTQADFQKVCTLPPCLLRLCTLSLSIVSRGRADGHGNKIYASNLQLHRIRLPLKYIFALLPQSHSSKFQHNKSICIMRTHDKALGLVPQKLIIL